MYWRIPGYLSAVDLQGVVSVLSEQLASGAPPLEEEENELQKDDTDEEECTEQVAPASPALDPELDNNVDDVEGTICNKIYCDQECLQISQMDAIRKYFISHSADKSICGRNVLQSSSLPVAVLPCSKADSLNIYIHMYVVIVLYVYDVIVRW